MLEYRYSFTQTIAENVLFKLEYLFSGNIQDIINYCKYYIEMYLHNPKVIKEYWIMPEIFGLIDRTKKVTPENIKNTRLHFHGIILVNDYTLFLKKIYSLKKKLGFNKLNYISCQDRFMYANNYMFKFQFMNPPVIQYFSTHVNKLSDEDKINIWNHTHRHKKDPLVVKLNKGIMSYFQ